MNRGSRFEHGWTAAQDARLSTEWRRGTSIKLIAHEVGHSESAVKSRRVKLGLPARNTGNMDVEMTVYLPKDLHRAATRRATERGTSLSAYLRMLIQRDT